ncbi:MAG TPA: Na+/H+ antiporter [Pseudonocardia sp.]|uniref:Na+/H+ antiporter n=1 Tax=Pseudonocardia sp. TaxID=60912 RepID=UPI002B6C36DB|nr:Na+/H+ antiporter [Pseudonocardia sp.]HTF46145.1 Na+/H+ antiporter [Pseudonocardia sp.]
MEGVSLIALVLGSLAVTAVCRRLRMSPTLVLVVVGIAVSFIPGIPDFQIDPDVVLLLVLTPLLYSAALDSSYLGFRANLRPISLLAVGLVIFSTAVIGLAAWWLIPGLPLPAALVLGAVVAPPDAVAAIAVGRRLGLPRRVMTVLAGESLVNDATALTLFRVAMAAAAGASISLLSGLAMFLFAAVGGVLIGLAVAWVVHWIRVRLNDPPIESALGLVVPFAVYLIAEEAHSSGLLAVVAAGLYLGYRAPETGFATRLQDDAVWRASDTVLESVVFALIGLQLTNVVREVGAIGPLVVTGAILTAVTVLARVVWVYPATYLPRLLPAIRRGDPFPNWRTPAVISWAGMRGVVSLAAAFAITPGVPYRDQLVFLAFFITVGTLLLHGLTLPWLIRKLGVRGEETQADALAEAQAQHAAGRAAVARLDELAEGTDAQVAQHSVQKLRYMAQLRSNTSWERLGRPAEETGESPTSAYRRLRREMVAAERETFVQYRDDGRIDDEVLRRVLRELDLEEAMLSRED